MESVAPSAETVCLAFSDNRPRSFDRLGQGQAQLCRSETEISDYFLNRLWTNSPYFSSIHYPHFQIPPIPLFLVLSFQHFVILSPFTVSLFLWFYAFKKILLVLQGFRKELKQRHVFNPPSLPTKTFQSNKFIKVAKDWARIKCGRNNLWVMVNHKMNMNSLNNAIEFAVKMKSENNDYNMRGNYSVDMFAPRERTASSFGFHI